MLLGPQSRRQSDLRGRNEANSSLCRGIQMPRLAAVAKSWEQLRRLGLLKNEAEKVGMAIPENYAYNLRLRAAINHSKSDKDVCNQYNQNPRSALIRTTLILPSGNDFSVMHHVLQILSGLLQLIHEDVFLHGILNTG